MAAPASPDPTIVSSAAPAALSALSAIGLTKRFGSNTALDGVSFSVASGTIHALLGENGAGKSTLMKIAAGLQPPDAGMLSVHGKPARFASPVEALAAGIGMVHQHFMLVEAFTVAENVALGRRDATVSGNPNGLSFKRREVEAEIERLGAETGLRVNPAARVSELSVGDRQRVEILKVLARGAQILLLDEPTAVLAPPEVRALFETLQKLREAGRTLVIVTHKLDEVCALASAATVLRQGRMVFEGPLSGRNPRDLARLMVGEALAETLEHLKASAEQAELERPPLLTVQNLAAPAQHGSGLKACSFTLRAGEILGVAGVEGNGQDELAGTLAGTLEASAGAQAVLAPEGDLLTRSITERVLQGLAIIPSDRQREGLILEFTLAENLALRSKSADTQVREKLTAYGVQPPEPEYLAGQLSGGNQQKVVLARELSRNPRLLIACNPTRGLDVGAAAAVHQRLSSARAGGAGILLISSDLDEVLRLSDRVAVLYGGQLKELGGRGVGKELAGRAMAGLD